MKITLSQLRRIIKEEVSKVMLESPEDTVSKLKGMYRGPGPSTKLTNQQLQSKGIKQTDLDNVKSYAEEQGIQWLEFSGDGVTVHDPEEQ